MKAAFEKKITEIVESESDLKAKLEKAAEDMANLVKFNSTSSENATDLSKKLSESGEKRLNLKVQLETLKNRQ